MPKFSVPYTPKPREKRKLYITHKTSRSFFFPKVRSQSECCYTLTTVTALLSLLLTPTHAFVFTMTPVTALTMLGIFIIPTSSTFRCPERCRCLVDERNKKVVECDAGSLGSEIPVFDMDRETQILTISSEERQPRVLTVGPIFSPLVHLEEVHITRANVPTIGENSFWGLRHLKLLNLTHNNVSSIRSPHLSGLRTLKALHLDYNKIDAVASATFMSLAKLETLTISNNRLRALTPRMFFLLSSLKTLDISGNPIRELDPEVLKDLPSLRVLKCSRCELTRVRSLVYKRLTELEELDLQNNKIEILSPGEYMDLKYLKVLRLDGNRLFELRDFVFRGLGLRELGLSHNHMEKISHLAFRDCTVLGLDLSSNRLGYSSLKQTRPILEHVHDMDISSNKMSSQHLKELLKRAPRLKKLNVSRMHLNQLLPDMFESQSKLESLNISKNNLTFIPVDVLQSLGNLKVLDLTRNKIKGLSEFILRRLDRVREVHLSNNPWSCDQCHIPNLKNWINNSKQFRDACSPNVDAPNCLKCQEPVEMFDKPIVEVEGLALQPCPEGSFDLATANASNSTLTLILVIVTACVVIVLLAIILIIGIIMYNRHSAYYYTHEGDNRRHFYENPGLHSNHTDVTMADDLDTVDFDVEAAPDEQEKTRSQDAIDIELPSKEEPINEPENKTYKMTFERKKKGPAPLPFQTS